MSGSPKKPYSNATISPSLGWDRVYLFLFFFLFFINGIVGQNSTIPIYDWESEAPLPTVNVNLLTLSVNSEDITISVATDPQGNVYTLFFGKGIAKRNAAGVLINANFIPASRFNSPLDMAIDENGFIYVADYFAGGETFTDNGKIWVFSPDGVLLSSKTIYTSFYRPLGVDVDDEKVYVAEFNDGNSGPERNQLSRIGIYDKNLVLPPRYILDVNTPYRIAVDSKKWIYVSQAGNNSPSVRYYDQNFVFQNTLSNILSPGSIVIDPFDFIHVIEYDGRINFSQFINFENLNFSQVQALAKSIDDGQKAGAFSIKIFDAARVIRKTFKDQIIFPVDLTFNQCDKMYVNNAEIFGGPSIIGYLPSKLEFDLEIYKRTPSFDLSKPLLTCPANITVTAESGATSAVVTYTPPTPTDNCSFPELTREGPAPGSSFPLGTTTITYTATDEAGNSVSCSFTITVNPATEVDDAVFENCPPDDITGNTDLGQCFTIVTFPTPTASDSNGIVAVVQTKGPKSGEEFPVGNTEVIFEATGSNGNTVRCSFNVIVVDHEFPAIDCPEDIVIQVEEGRNYATVTFSNATATDNCSATVTQTGGSPSGSQFPVGEHIIEFTATDETGNSVSCSFTITVNPATEVDDAVFENCAPDDITGNTDQGQCFAIVTFSTPTASDSNGIVTVIQTKGPKSGEEFPVGNTEVIFEATGSNGNTVRCSFNVIVVDHEFPVIDCPEDIVIQVEEGKNYAIVTFSNATATDNCSAIVSQTGGSPSGSQFPVGEHIIEFTATDKTGNSVSCSFTITVNPATEVDDAVFENCAPDDITGNTDQGQCFAIVTFSTPTASDSNGIVTVIQTKGPKSGEEFPVGDTEVVFEATGSNGNTVRCSFNVTIKDIVNPTITCTGDQIENYDPTLGFPVPDYTNFAGVTDNCEVAGVVQTPVPGTIIFDDTSIILEVTDTSGNSAKCDFMLRLTEEEVLEISCLEDVTEEISDSCNFIIPDYKNRANVNFDGAIITQTPAEGSVITSTTTIILTANLNGETDSCSFQLFLKDTQLPTLTCPREQIETFDPAVGFNVPDYRTIANPSDNCSFEWLQVPAAGTIIYESRLIEISATDLAGNQAWCNFSLQLEAIEPLELTCPENQIADYINNCSFTIPDYTGLAQVSDNNASITQFPEIGTVVFENTTITLTATLDGKTDDCSFELLLEDTTNPTITCPEDQIENYDLAVGFPVPDYTGFADVSDNCEVAGVTQTPPPGTILFEDTSIILEVTDTSGNSAKCDFMLRLTEDVVLEITCIEDQTILLTESCSFTLPDYTQDAEVNFEGATIVQSPAAGTIITSNTIVRLTASFEDETDDCVFQVLLDDIVAPEISCIENGTEFVLTNGSLTLSPSDFDTGTTDNCSFTLSLSQTTFTAIGSYSVTMRATDDNGNYSECTKTINIVEATSSDFSCLTSDIVLLLDDSGNAILKPEDAFTGNPGNTTFTLSKSSFNCADIGTQPVTLFYDGDNTGSCEVRVVVKDESTPTVRTKNITVFLNQQGVVNLTPDLINDGSSDNCSGITYSIDKTILGCKDRGQTTVTLTVTDASGNSATGTAIVTLTGFCEEEPEEPVEFEEFIYIYPNPTTGPVNFYVPKSKKIERVELFDSRDRFIMQKVFPDGTLHYNIDLTGLQSSVYIFHIRTESGTRIIRVIVK